MDEQGANSEYVLNDATRGSRARIRLITGAETLILYPVEPDKEIGAVFQIEADGKVLAAIHLDKDGLVKLRDQLSELLASSLSAGEA